MVQREIGQNEIPKPGHPESSGYSLSVFKWHRRKKKRRILASFPGRSSIAIVCPPEHAVDRAGSIFLPVALIQHPSQASSIGLFSNSCHRGLKRQICKFGLLRRSVIPRVRGKVFDAVCHSQGLPLQRFLPLPPSYHR